jgi:3-oxoacyl-[acyl-carrier-protein] synthase II
MTGHLKEAQFPFAISLAALALRRKSGYPAFDPDNEKPFDGAPKMVLATSVGYSFSEGMALVTAVD